MSVFKSYEYDAALMLQCDVRELPAEVEEELEDLNKLCEAANGKLISRQIIAQVVYNYNNKLNINKEN